MKKILVVCAALMLPCLLVHAQEADSTETGTVLNIIPRLDLNPMFSTKKGVDNDFNLGNSSLYTLFEGDITENISFSIANHWLSREPKYLYKHLVRSDDVNWLDWGYLTFKLSDKWSLSAGKVVVTTGGFEEDDYDWNVHPQIGSGFWNYLPVYQWGGSLDWQVNENNTLTAQMSCSPYGRRPLKSGLFNYSAQWRGTFGNFETLSSFTFVQHTKFGKGTDFFDCFQKVLTIGLRANWEPAVVTLDVFNKVGNEEELLVNGITVVPSVLVSINDNMEVLGKVAFEHMSDKLPDFSKDAVRFGGAFHWRPIKDNDALRLHAVASYDSISKMVTLSAGVLYNFSIKVN